MDLKSLGYKENCCNDHEINENCVEVLKDAGLLESNLKANLTGFMTNYFKL